MGDRYILIEKCPYCDKKNDEIWYAPTCNSYTSICEHCDKQFFIKPNLSVIKLEDVKLEDIENGFWMTTIVDHDEDDVERECKNILKNLKGGIKKNNDKNKRKNK